MNSSAFDGAFTTLFGAQFPRLYRYLDRISGEPDLAADLAQDAFTRLYRRGSMPEQPEAWLVTVALNLMRNAKSMSARRLTLLTPERARSSHADTPTATDQAAGPAERQRVRRALDQMPRRDAELLALRAEGYSYRELAVALDLNEASIGTLLARAKRAFRAAYGDGTDAPD